MENNIAKPLTIIYDEFVIDLRDLINNSGLPAFIIEPVLKDAYNLVKTAEQKQLENDKKLYQEMIDASEGKIRQNDLAETN